MHWKWRGSYPTMLKMIHIWGGSQLSTTSTRRSRRPTHSPLSRRKLVVICIHPLSRQSFHRPERKLTPNLRDIVRYVVHNRNLKLYLQLSLVVPLIHRVFALNSLNSFLKDVFNLMNNSIFGSPEYIAVGPFFVSLSLFTAPSLYLSLLYISLSLIH